MGFNNKNKKRMETKDQVILRQIDRIDALKRRIAELEVGSAEKDEVINDVEGLRNELIEVVEGLKDKDIEYSRLIDELREMRNILNASVFKKHWRLIKLLMK